MKAWRVLETLKSDSFGRVERIESPQGSLVRRVACGARLPGSALIARVLMRRERRALRALEDLPGIPRLFDGPVESAIHGADLDESGRQPRRGAVLLRSWIDGQPLHRAEELAADFFDHLDELVAAVHARNVCHNDLHKEQNIMVGSDGFPYLIDFQLASVHPQRGILFRSRVKDDLRHTQKHRRRYTRGGRGPASAAIGRGHGLSRGGVALFWRRTGKPLYNFVTRTLLRTRDGEPRRQSDGPWPKWVDARGSRDQNAKAPIDP